MNAESAVLGPPTLVRSRLADLMLAAAPHAPCLLSAPTGFGRTTALRQAAARAGPESAQLVSVAADDPGAWVRLRRRLEDARGEGRIRYVLVDCDGVASSSEAEEARAALIEDVAIWSGLIMSSQESLDEVTLRFPGSILLDRSDLAFTDEELILLERHYSEQRLEDGGHASVVRIGGRPLGSQILQLPTQL